MNGDLFMKGNFKDREDGIATIAGIMIFVVGFIATVIISVSVSDFGYVFALPGIILTLLLAVAVESELSKGKFSADDKSVAFSMGFSKYEYSYKNIANAKTETTFTNGRYGKIPHVELVLSLQSGETVRFSDNVPFCESDTLEGLKEFQKNHQFTKLADYIKSKL